MKRRFFMNAPRVESIKRIGTGLSFIMFPILSIIGYAAHPNLLSLSRVEDVASWVQEIHGNSILQFGHVLVLLSVPLIIIIALKFMGLLKGRGEWFGFLGGSLAIFGAIILAADKGALCLVISAFDTLPEGQFTQLLPGLQTMMDREGWLVLLWLLLLLPIGFVIQGAGLFVTRVIPRWQSILIVIGALLLTNPDIEIISLIASIILLIAMAPIGIKIIKGSTTG